MFKKFFAGILSLLLVLSFSACKKEPPKVYFYGEGGHGMEININKSYELWYNYYHNEGMRHLFIETSYAGAQLLNIWMQSENDEILDMIRSDIEGTFGYAKEYFYFYKLIKENCPETVFHGNDVGHQYDTTCVRYLEYLEANGMKNSEEYSLTLENIEQGKKFYEMYDPNLASGIEGDNYREEKMAENFIREFDSLGGESVMGIYGNSHADISGMSYYNQELPCMANMISQYYGESVTTVYYKIMDLTTKPLSVHTIEFNGKEYAASYWGKRYAAPLEIGYEYLVFYRLENAYEDVKDYKLSINLMLQGWIFPMYINENDVFAVDFIKSDGSSERAFFATVLRNGNPWAKEIIIE